MEEKLELQEKRGQREMSKFYFRFIEICISLSNRTLLSFHYRSDIKVQMRVSRDDHRSCVIHTEGNKHAIKRFNIGDWIQSDQGRTRRRRPFILRPGEVGVSFTNPRREHFWWEEIREKGARRKRESGHEAPSPVWASCLWDVLGSLQRTGIGGELGFQMRRYQHCVGG